MCSVGVRASWKYEQDGVTKYTTEVVIPNFGGVLTMLDSRNQSDSNQQTDQIESAADASVSPTEDNSTASKLDDDIPF